MRQKNRKANESAKRRKLGKTLEEKVEADYAPEPLRPFGRAADAKRLMESVNEEWERVYEDDKDERAAFPRIPSGRARSSIDLTLA